MGLNQRPHSAVKARAPRSVFDCFISNCIRWHTCNFKETRMLYMFTFSCNCTFIFPKQVIQGVVTQNPTENQKNTCTWILIQNNYIYIYISTGRRRHTYVVPPTREFEPHAKQIKIKMEAKTVYINFFNKKKYIHIVQSGLGWTRWRGLYNMCAVVFLFCLYVCLFFFLFCFAIVSICSFHYLSYVYLFIY